MMGEENLISEQSKDTVQTIPLAYHEVCMERNRRIVKTLAISWMVSVVLIVLSFVYLWLQYDYVSMVESSGIYNLVDSAGNVISSDIMPEDIPAILEAIENSKSTENTGTEAEK